MWTAPKAEHDEPTADRISEKDQPIRFEESLIAEKIERSKLQLLAKWAKESMKALKVCPECPKLPLMLLKVVQVLLPF